MAIYLIEDDQDFSAEFTAYVTDHGLTARWLQSSAELRELIARDVLSIDDLIILDLALHGVCTLDYLPALRATGALCIVLTAESGQETMIRGLDLGADDYIVKTAPMREVVARIHAVRRRGSRHDTTADRGVFGTAWMVDESRWEVHSPRGEHIRLTGHEFKLLATLMRSEGYPISRATLSIEVFGREASQYDRAVDNLVTHIRRKFRPYVDKAEFIRSVRLEGYVFVGFPDQSERRHAKRVAGASS